MKAKLLIAIVLVLALSYVAQAAPSAAQAPGGSKFGPLGPASRAAMRQMARSQPGQAAIQAGFTPSQLECRVTGDPSANINLDCDGILPNDEPHIGVDPADPKHMVASSNDYESCCDQFYTTFNGGHTWRTGDMSALENATGSDPVTTFDRKHGTVIHSSLNYFFTAAGESKNGHVVVSISKDGGITWRKPVIVARGFGADSDPVQLFNDKEWIVTDNNPSSPFYGRTYLTWTAFLSRSGNYQESPIWEAHSDDGGFTWSAPQEISGSNQSLCTFQEDGPAGECDQSQASVPTVDPSGDLYVAFLNDQNTALLEPGESVEDPYRDDQYLVVKSSDGGVTWSRPRFVAGLEDGSRDYPLNVDERQTLTDYQVRVWSAGNIVADPTQDDRLYLVFSDNRNGRHDVDNPVTNTDVFLVTSTDGGRSWSDPSQVNPRDSGAGNDQWFPWVDVNPGDGTVGVLYHDRSYSDDHGTYQTSFSESPPGGTDFTYTKVSTAASHPRQSVFFQADVPGCRHCAVFHGDYNSVAYGSDGSANLVWTDMRDLDSETGLYLQFIYFARR